MGKQRPEFVFHQILFELVHFPLLETPFIQFLQSVNNVEPKR